VGIQTANKSNEKTAKQPNLGEVTCKLREIQVGLKCTLADLQQKLGAFDSEPELLTNLENARSDAEDRASSLEAEVKQLRGELKALRDFLKSTEEKK
jgi:predicted  nucleic acid-binding Zn-ribbon protein